VIVEDVLILIHILAVFWYVMGLAAVQSPHPRLAAGGREAEGGGL